MYKPAAIKTALIIIMLGAVVGLIYFVRHPKAVEEVCNAFEPCTVSETE